VKHYTYLALGDSYTIGEGVPIFESFPYQAVQLLRSENKPILAPEIIAKTGWTTDELSNGIAGTRLLPSYDFVSLLIGVNNQYRGRTAAAYEPEFEDLLMQAIQLAGQQTHHVFVLSIPDWSVTPFANSNLPDTSGRTSRQVAGEIDDFNAAAMRIAQQYGISFLDITPHTRATGSDPSWLASDGLHPSGKEYRHWAALLAKQIGPALEHDQTA